MTWMYLNNPGQLTAPRVLVIMISLELNIFGKKMRAVMGTSHQKAPDATLSHCWGN